jgi:hypothetical protein
MIVDNTVLNDWYEIRGFRSPNEFENFQFWIASQIEAGKARRVPVPKHTPGFTDDTEQYFICVDDGSLWKLMYPDSPFRGAFTKV